MAYNMLKSSAEEGKETGPQWFETYCVQMVLPLLVEWISVRRNASWLNSSSLLKAVSFKAGIPGWKLVKAMKCTELLKVFNKKKSGHDTKPANKENTSQRSGSESARFSRTSVGTWMKMLQCHDALYATANPKMKCICVQHVGGTIIFARSISLNVSI